MDNKFGFKPDDLSMIVQTISNFPEIVRAVIFGSRVKGNHKPGSDVDIAVWTRNNKVALKLSGILNDETLLPYKFDVLDYDAIDNQDLKDHIDRLGVELYKA